MKDGNITSKRNMQVFVLSTVIALVLSILVLAIFIYALQPASSIASSLIAQNDALSNNELQKVVTIVQNDIYEVVITFLIFANSIIAALSVWYIKTNAEEKAEQVIQAKLDKYLSSYEFDRKVSEEVEMKGSEFLRLAQQNLEEQAKDLVETAELIYHLRDSIQTTERSVTELERQLKIVAQTVSKNDQAEEKGRKFRFRKGGL